MPAGGKTGGGARGGDERAGAQQPIYVHSTYKLQVAAKERDGLQARTCELELGTAAAALPERT